MPTTADEQGELVELRCPNDGRLLLKASDLAGVTVEVKCMRCGELITAKRERNERNETTEV